MAKPLSHYFGAKSEMLDFLYENTPAGEFTTAVEVSCGMASWMLGREPSPVDVINDKNPRIANLFWCLRSRKLTEELVRLVGLTPYSAHEFDRCRAPAENKLEDARRFLVLLRQSMGTAPGKAWSRVIAHSRRGMASGISRWLHLADSDIRAVAERLRHVQVDNLDFEACIKKYDRPTTLFYIDPPYLADTRTTAKTYEYEMSRDDHKRLLGCVLRAHGAFVISGYAAPLYDNNLTVARGWRRAERRVACRSNIRPDGTVANRASRVEVVWSREARPCS